MNAVKRAGVVGSEKSNTVIVKCTTIGGVPALVELRVRVHVCWPAAAPGGAETVTHTEVVTPATAKA